MGSIAPTISHALQAGRDARDGWIEVCTTLGVKYVRANEAVPGEQKPASPADHARLHCPYCALHVTGLGLPPAPLAVPWALLPQTGVPAFFPDGLHRPPVWLAAQPRAPPVFS